MSTKVVSFKDSGLRKKIAGTHHPVTTLIRAIGQNVHVDVLGRLVVPGLDGLGQLDHVSDRVGLQQVLVVEVVEEDIQSPLRIVNLRLERRRRTRLDSLHVCRQNLIDGHRVRGDVGTVTGCCTI